MVLDGKQAAAELFSRLSDNITKVRKSLVAIQAGDDPSSTLYINMKKKKAEEIGIEFIHTQLAEDIDAQDLIGLINNLNEDNRVGGILIQLPLPSHLDTQRILDCISPDKDIDCLSSESLGNFFSGRNKLLPATPHGVLKLLEFYNINPEGKDICIIGASNLVGKPLAIAFTNIGATVTLCHIKTEDIRKYSRTADIVITAVGKPKIFTADYFSERQTVIDIGTSKGEDGKIYGDVDFESVSKTVENITPVPGGAGPMTIYALMENFVNLNN